MFSYRQKVFVLKIINCREGRDLALAASDPSVTAFFLDGSERTQGPGNPFPPDGTSSHLGFRQVGIAS